MPFQKQKLQLREELANKSRLAPQIGGDVTRKLSLEEQFGAEASPADWKRIGKAAGAVAGAACVLGVLAGWWSAGDIGEPQEAQKAAAAPLPPVDVTEVSQPVPPQDMTEATPDRPKRAAGTAERIERPPATPRLSATEVQPEASQEGATQTPENQPDPLAYQEGAGEQVEAAEAPAPTAAASLPLPNKLVSRTIERIGYSCGGVTSSSPVEGEAPGVYKITCASGQSYQAKPVNGRYRFRRWGRP